MLILQSSESAQIEPKIYICSHLFYRLRGRTENSLARVIPRSKVGLAPRARSPCAKHTSDCHWEPLDMLLAYGSLVDTMPKRLAPRLRMSSKKVITFEDVEKAQPKTARQCGVCGEEGHDKRNCPVFKKATNEVSSTSPCSPASQSSTSSPSTASPNKRRRNE